MNLPDRTIYLHEALAPARLMRVLDVGANPLSDPPYKPLLDAGLCDVWGFEPQDEAFAELMKIKGPHETYFPHAVADGQRHTLHISKNSGFTSILPFHQKGFSTFGIFPGAARNLREIEVDTVRLDDLDDLPLVDVLKMDIQGGEKIVIDNGREKLSQAICVIPEVRFNQFYDGEPMFAGVDESLRDQGFMLHKFMFMKSAIVSSSMRSQIAVKDNSNHLVDGDAIYIRDLRDPDVVTDEQLKFLTLAADNIFKSFDLVFHCLD
ncbi:MAG: FkbM family methyltransferase, partial [Alphaproteobacteria bacterium]|nr:FkbM family methyltransferase [Alphaproteobacteria bacterium]